MQTNQEFTAAVEHHCEGLTVAVGCAGIRCEYAEGDELHNCEPSFSRHGCDSCGSSLGGDRFPAYGLPTGDGWRDHSDPIAMQICVDCVQLHANGELPY